MVLYECKPCNFQTNLKSNFTRHQNTKKHGLKILESENFSYENEKRTKKNQKEPDKKNKKKKNQKEPVPALFQKKNEKKNEKKFECLQCGSFFKTFASKRRHEIHRCPNKMVLSSNDNAEMIEALKEQNRLVKEMMEQKLEKFEAILKEKERCIDVLKDQIGSTSNHNTFNLIKNDIYTMKPLEFLNTFFINNPSLDEVIGTIQNDGLGMDELQRIRNASTMNAKHLIAREFDNILKSRNRKMINNTPLTCDNVLFTNDGSNRRYIAKGTKEWQFYSTDEPLNNSTDAILEKVNSDNNKPILMNKKERVQINNSIKKLNDFNDIREHMLQRLDQPEKSSIEVTIQNATQEIPDSTTIKNRIENDINNENVNQYDSDIEIEYEIDNEFPLFNTDNMYCEMVDCGTKYLFDESDNVFNKETKEYIGVRVHDEECTCDGNCWYYIKYLNEI